MAEVTYINATFKCCGFSEKQLCNAGRIEFLPSHGSNESASLLNSFPFEETTHTCSRCANPALVAYNPGPTSHSKVISLLETLLSAITLLSCARFVTSQACNAIVSVERKWRHISGAKFELCGWKNIPCKGQQNLHI